MGVETKQWKGLCIGGPRNGELYVHDKPDFAVLQYNKFDWNNSNPTTTIYYHLQREGLGYWILQGDTVDCMRDLLVLMYRNYGKSNGTP